MSCFTTTWFFSFSHFSHYFPGWENPSVFDPERFSQSKKGAYMPFGVGSRACPAGNFGVLAAKSILVYLIKNKNVYTLQGLKSLFFCLFERF